MVQLSAYAERVIDRLNLIGMWLSLIVCARNFFVCLNQYQRSRGKIHLVNIAQVTVFFIHRLLYGIIPLFEISTCAFFPLLVSLWHIDYLLIYIVMFMRLLILEHNRHSTWIKIVSLLLVGLRFSDWPYELAFHSIQQDIAKQAPMNGETCWAQWGNGVIILNFVGDALANLFLSGMFIRRLLIHMNSNDAPVTKQNVIIERIARKSLVCLASTFIVNIIMNILKITSFLGDRSDAFTVYFEIIESTLLVEALRNDFTTAKDSQFCDNCGKKIDDMLEQGPNNVDEERNNILRSSFGSRSGRRPESMDEVTNSKQDLNPGMAVLRSLPVPRKQVSSDSEKISKQQGTYNASIFEYTHPSLVGSATFSKDFHPPVDPPEKSSSIGSMSNNSKITLDEFP